MIHISRYVETPKGFGFVKDYTSDDNNEVLYIISLENGKEERFNQYEVKQVGNGRIINKK